MQITDTQMDEFLRIQMQSSNQATRQQSQATSPNTFGNFLNEALTKQEQNQNNAAVSLLPHGTGQSEMISQMLLNPVNNEASAHNEQSLLENTFSNASGTLDLWDSYTQKLGTYEQTDLRAAYSILESIGSKVEELKASASNLNVPNFGLNSLINQMDIMATTEKIKFNRGDYA
ncbi:MAG: hypothetical protein IJT59_00200 [Desulfovibrionaceae bacterium]|nr:hypothetical protein [Desulfovibrionaceae bacterium]